MLSLQQRNNKNKQYPNGYCLFLVRETGLEPVRVAPHAPQTCASADSATLASTLCIIAERYIFVNTFFINFYIFFEKRCNSRKPAKNAGFQALHHLHFSLFRLFSKKYFKKHFISTVKHTSIFSYKYRISISGSSPLYSSITA